MCMAASPMGGIAGIAAPVPQGVRTMSRPLLDLAEFWT